MRFKGAGLDNIYQKARIWFRKSGEQGYPDAQFCFGECYAEG
jgi:TPR repeat protein